VILDGNGHLLDSASQESTSNQRAVYVNGSAERRENVTVRNVEFTDWPRGVYVYNASGLRVADVTVRLRNDSDLRGRLGVRFHGVRNSVVEGSTFQGYPAGIRATKGYRQLKNANNRYVSNTFQGKGDISIHEAKNVTVEGNTFSTDGATAWGIYVDSEGGSVANNVVDGGAIWLGGTGTTVQTNTVRDTDISLSSDHFALEIRGDGHDVRNNTVVNASRGMGVGGSDHVLRDNELRNSRENFHVGTFGSTRDADPASFDVDQSNTVDGDPIYVFGGVSGQTVSGVNAGYVAYADSTDVTVRDVRVSNATEGLYLHNVSGLTVENATLSENGNGIVARGAENVTVRDSRLTDNTFNGIEVAAIYLGERAKHWTLDNVTITGAGQEVDRLEREEDNVGVFYKGTNVTIADSNVSHNTNGLAFIDAENVTLRDSVVSDNGGDGVWLRAGSSEFVGNDVSDNGKNGIIAWTGRAMVANNTFDRNGWSGLRIGRLVREGTIYIRNNTAGDNTYGIGIFPDSPGDFVYDDITLDDNVVVGNNVTDNQYGIYLADRAENNTLRNNTARLNEVGIHLSNTANNRVVDNNASDNSDDGIRLDGYDGKKTMETDAFVVRNNSLVSNGDDGVALDDATTGSNYESGPFAVRDNDVRANGDEGIVVE
jgi:parallel beta-helix repeat protein